MKENKKQFLGSDKNMPEFLIIGAMKCGTTNLYKNLVQHSSIVSANKKEIYFFNSDENYSKGLDWYKSQFPLLHRKNENKQGLITGEGTPGYLFNREAPERIFKDMPDVKLIVLLRNPVDRAYSHYRHIKRNGREKLSFKEAISREEKGIVEPGIDRNFLGKGNYVEQLKRWMSFFPREQFLIIKSEDYYRNPIKEINQVCRFLNLPEWNYKYSRGPGRRYPKMKKQMREKLSQHFKPLNQELEDYLGVKFNWDS